jgi:hypothetical protein
VLTSGDKDGPKKLAADGALTVTIKQWGVRLCAPPGVEDKVQAGLLFNSRIAAVGSEELLWERDELYIDGECYYLRELSSPGQLLRKILSLAIENASGKLVHEIRFP